MSRLRSAARAFADPAAAPQRPPLEDLTREVGIPGGVIESGLTIGSYHTDLRGPAWFRKVDEMLLASSQAAVVEAVVTLPLISADWRIAGGDPALRRLCETSLWGSAGMSTTWKEVLANAVSCAIYGTAIFELIWKETTDGLLLRRLMDRDPSSVSEYLFGDDGGLRGIQQTGTDPENGKEITVEVPIEKLLLLPYRLRRRDYHGRSVLRPAYRHYESIAMICAIADIGLDHSMVGLPVGRAPAGAKQGDMAVFRDLLSLIRRHEASGLVLPPGWDLVDGARLGGTSDVAFLDYLQWHEGCLLRAGLAGFMQLGSTPTGTTELGGALMEFALLSWGALGDLIAGVISRHALRRICDYNASRALTEADYPELIAPDVRAVFGGQAAAGQYLGAVASGQESLPADRAGVQAAVRDGLRLPDGDSRAAGAPPQTQVGGTQIADGQPSAGDTASTRGHADVCPHQHFAEADRRAALALVRGDQAADLDEWQRAMRGHLADVLQELLAQVEAAGGDPVALAAVRAPATGVEAWSAAIAAWLTAVRDQAAARMAAEIGAEPPAAEGTRPLDQARAASIAAHLAEAARFEVITGALAGETVEQLAVRYAGVTDRRLRGDLSEAAQQVVDEVSADA